MDSSYGDLLPKSNKSALAKKSTKKIMYYNKNRKLLLFIENNRNTYINKHVHTMAVVCR